MRESKHFFHSCPAPYSSPNPFPEQPGDKLPLLSSGTSAWISLPSCWIPELLTHGLSFHVGFLHLFCICLQYILIAKEWHYWVAKDSLNFFDFPQAEGMCVVTSNVGNIQRYEIRPLTYCQSTTVIKHIIWADIHVSFFCKEHLALLWNIKKSLKVEKKGLKKVLNLICRPLRRDGVTAHHSFLPENSWHGKQNLMTWEFFLIVLSTQFGFPIRTVLPIFQGIQIWSVRETYVYVRRRRRGHSESRMQHEQKGTFILNL